ncbi:MAG: sialate O-acetylesterase [Chthoniobacter sp.]|jgi:sialate O-acetylesterase|nr:sialate O-acetylesterase [Chthoniobacter sp.]
MTAIKLFRVAATLLAMCAASAIADVTVNPMFSDHMVLQRERPLPVWGQASPDEAVTVTFAGETTSTKTGADGKWMVLLSPKEVSRQPQELTIKGNNVVTLKDVLVGDVWLGMGQSNMDWSLSSTDRREAIEKMPHGMFDSIRLFKVSEVQLDAPANEVKATWTEAGTREIMSFSATLFYFGEALSQRHPDVPLGLIRSSVGATNLYCWIPNELRDQDPSAEYLRTWWTNAIKSWSAEKQAQRDRELETYEAQLKAWQQRKENPPSDFKKPGELLGPKWSRRPSGLYNGMIAPLQPFALRGLIWYQGEWDSKHDWVTVYHDMFVAFARSLRERWAAASGVPRLGQFPIFLVQPPAREPNDGKYWPYMREVQERLATSVPDSGFVVTCDTNDPNELHPREKSPIGRRLCLLALAKAYNEQLAWRGPQLKSSKPEGDQLVLEFDTASDSLKSSDGQPLRHFEVAGDDGFYHAASAEIRGQTVLVTSPQVKHPTTVRYAFMPAPVKPNFYNSAGLPAAPFRTDSLPNPPM